MTNILEVFYKQSQNEMKSIYGEQESMKHMYYCKALNNIELKVDYENMFQGEIKNMKLIFNRFEQKMNKRNGHHHVILDCDPPSSVSFEVGHG